jgi:hypothetical protein
MSSRPTRPLPGWPKADVLDLAAPERETAVRRNTRLLLFAQALSQVSLAPPLLVGGPAVAKFSGSTTVAGLFLACRAAKVDPNTRAGGRRC